MTRFDSEESETITLLSSADVVVVRHRARDRAVEVGLNLVAQTKLVTATSELARNCIDYGGGGWATIDIVRDSGLKYRRGVRIVFTDEGPGIPDVELALTDGWTSGRGLGLGLPGSRKLAHEFELETTVGVGTAVTIVFWEQ